MLASAILTLIPL